MTKVLSTSNEWFRVGHIVASVFFGSCVLVGCGGGSTDFAVAKVTGKVICQDQPVASGAVTFSPLQKAGKDGQSGKAAYGEIQPDGTFELSTYQSRDGAVVGRHIVSVGEIDPNKPLPGKLPANHEVEIKPGNNAITLELSPLK